MTDDIPIAVVSQDGFDRIECNRCGECCTGFFLNGMNGPIGYLEGNFTYQGSADDPNWRFADMLWIGQLEPWWDETLETWRYRCGHFSRDDEGLGVCGIYETRPWVCSAFPYGKPQTFWQECSWNVELFEFDIESGLPVDSAYAL